MRAMGMAALQPTSKVGDITGSQPLLHTIHISQMRKLRPRSGEDLPKVS